MSMMTDSFSFSDMETGSSTNSEKTRMIEEMGAHDYWYLRYQHDEPVYETYESSDDENTASDSNETRMSITSSPLVSLSLSLSSSSACCHTSSTP